MSVPSTVVIQNGAASANFTVTGQDDAIADGAQSVTITASAVGHGQASDTVLVTDDDGGGGGPIDDHGDNAAASTMVAVPSQILGAATEEA